MSIVLTTGGPVNFPGLGLNFDKLIEGFTVFGVHISLTGILIAAAMFLGLFITECLARKSGQNPEHYLDLAIRVVLAGIVGARTGYVLSHWQYFITDQGSVFDITDGGLSAAGAIIAGLIVSFLYCRQKKLSWLQVCDTALPGVLTGQVLATAGGFFGRKMLGTYSDGMFAMQVALQDVDAKALKLGRAAGPMVQGNFLQVHPVAIYETAILLVLLLLLLVLRKIKNFDGMVLVVYLIGYGGMVFAMEFIRLDSQKIFESAFSVEHMVAAGVILMGILVLGDRWSKEQVKNK